MTSPKAHFSETYNEFNTYDVAPKPQAGASRIIESVRLGLTVLSLLIGIAILAITAHALVVFNATHLSQDFLLPLWPYNFDLRPTVAELITGCVVIVAGGTSLVGSKMSSVSSLYYYQSLPLPDRALPPYGIQLTCPAFCFSSSHVSHVPCTSYISHRRHHGHGALLHYQHQPDSRHAAQLELSLGGCADDLFATFRHNL